MFNNLGMQNNSGSRYSLKDVADIIKARKRPCRPGQVYFGHVPASWRKNQVFYPTPTRIGNKT